MTSLETRLSKLETEREAAALRACRGWTARLVVILTDTERSRLAEHVRYSKSVDGWMRADDPELAAIVRKCCNDERAARLYSQLQAFMGGFDGSQN